MVAFSSVQFSCSVVSNSLRPEGLQHARLPCPSPTPGVYPSSCPLSRWCHPTISSLLSPSPPAFSLSQHQGLFHWVRSLHQVAKVYSCFTVLLVSTLWQSASAIHLYTYPLFLGVPFHLGHRRILSRVPCATQQVLISCPFYAWYQ